MKTVLLNAGIPLEVNPNLVVAVTPNEQKPESSSIIHLLGQKFKVRGSHEQVAKALAWKVEVKIGFPEEKPTKETANPDKAGPEVVVSAREVPGDVCGDPSVVID